jgi:hypothetical protein
LKREGKVFARLTNRKVFPMKKEKFLNLGLWVSMGLFCAGIIIG